MSEAKNLRKVFVSPPPCLHPVEGIEIVDTRYVHNRQVTRYRGSQEALIKGSIVPAEAFAIGRKCLTLWLEYPVGRVIGRTTVQRRKSFYFVDRAHPLDEPPYMPLPKGAPFTGLDFFVPWPPEQPLA